MYMRTSHDSDARIENAAVSEYTRRSPFPSKPSGASIFSDPEVNHWGHLNQQRTACTQIHQNLPFLMLARSPRNKKDTPKISSHQAALQQKMNSISKWAKDMAKHTEYFPRHGVDPDL
jgi:hypothetical protein